jgi:hypothetical protein
MGHCTQLTRTLLYNDTRLERDLVLLVMTPAPHTEKRRILEKSRWTVLHPPLLPLGCRGLTATQKLPGHYDVTTIKPYNGKSFNPHGTKTIPSTARVPNRWADAQPVKHPIGRAAKRCPQAAVHGLIPRAVATTSTAAKHRNHFKNSN